MNFRKLLKGAKGATAIEYALVASFISIAAIGAMQALGGQSKTGWQGVEEKTKTAVGY